MDSDHEERENNSAPEDSLTPKSDRGGGDRSDQESRPEQPQSDQMEGSQQEQPQSEESPPEILQPEQVQQEGAQPQKPQPEKPQLELSQPKQPQPDQIGRSQQEQPQQVATEQTEPEQQEAMVAGRILSVQGPVVEVKFDDIDQMPALWDVLSAKTFDGREVLIEVAEHLDEGVVRCISLSTTLNIQKNSFAYATGKPITCPTGDEAFGRILDVSGMPLDMKPELAMCPRVPIRKPVSLPLYNLSSKIVDKPLLLETGIKIIDLLFPLVKGSKTGILGGAGCGKTVVILELMNNVVTKHSGACVFCGIGERIREGNELFYELADHNLLSKVMMVFGQMDQPPGARYEIVNTGITMAEYIQGKNKDVLLFMDNIFRFVQGGQEVSILLGRVPSETGYQPTMASEVAGVQERIRSIKGGGSITALQAVYVPADDMTDPAVVAISSYLDGFIKLSRDLVQKGFYPAVDPIGSASSNLDSWVVGKRHFDLAQQSIALINKYNSLKKIVQVIGVEELSKKDRIDYERSEKLINYMTQPFIVSEVYTGKKGEYVTIEENLESVERIIRGDFDKRKPKEFYMIGKAK